MLEKIIILANSNKYNGRCIAGKTEDGRWIRLAKEGCRSIPIREGIKFNIRSIYEVNTLYNKVSKGLPYHTEDYTYDSARCINISRVDKLDYYLDTPKSIFLDNRRFIEFTAAKCLQNSLQFIKVYDLRIYLYNDKLRCDFYYNGDNYSDFSVTESDIVRRSLIEEYKLNIRYREAYITISLGVPFYSNVYKLVSGVIPISVN